MSRLARDQRGNTLALVAASVIPLVGMVGGGVDMARAYLIKTRLQQACDAGVLAARRSMTGTALDQTARDQATSFFNINLRSGTYGSENVRFAVDDVRVANPVTGTTTANGAVTGVANADVPTTLMKVFGYNTIDLQATCEAELNVTNNDILFVLDTTGSMACVPARTEADCANNWVASHITTSGGRVFVTEETGSRISSLRTAVTNFFNSLSATTAPGARLQIGFLPYSSGVNVGGILPATAVVTSNANYQSRVGNFNSVRWRPSTSEEVTTQTYGTRLTQTNCNSYRANNAFSQSVSGNSSLTTSFSPNPAGSQAAPTAMIAGGSQPSTVVRYQYSGGAWANPTTRVGSTDYKTCTRDRTTSTTTYSARYGLTNWTYRSVSLAVGDYVAGNDSIVSAGTVASGTNTAAEMPNAGSYDLIALANAVANGTGTNMTVTNSARENCVIERTEGMNDIALAADTDARRWTLAWPAATYLRTDGNNQTTTATNTQPTPSILYYSCPKAAQHLATQTAADITNYVSAANGFLAHGYTYHDVGMIWGARMMLQNGIFASAHTAAPNGRPVSRHIIFMTDGDMNPELPIYSNVGIEQVERRVSPAGTADAGLKTLHIARFQAACTAAKNRGISVWVVSFAQALTTDLTNCASSSTQAFQANDAAQLNTAFTQIAQRIGELRLSQ